MNIKPLAVSLAFMSLAACASPSAYQPAERPHGNGYSDERLAENRFRVTFAGNSVTRRNTVENYLLLRSAEVTRDAGYQWFTFDTRDTEAKTTYHTDFADPGWGPGWGYGFGYYHSWRYDPWDPAWGIGGNAIPSTRYEAYAEIILLTPAQAKTESHALQASDVIARLGPAAAPPPAN